MPKVSIVIPIYNVEQYLRECLESVVNQTLKEIEIICVNDGSTDSSPEILKEYAEKDNRIKVISKPNSGYGHTMNVGIDAAIGEYIGIVESDDYVRIDMYELLYGICKKNDLDLIKGDFCRFYGDGESRKKENDSITHYHPLYNIVLNPSEDPDLLDCSLYTWAGIYKREFIKKNNIRHNETPGASYQDNGFWFQTFCLAKRLMFVDQVLYHLRRDNPKSSFYSKGKVFCICDEYDFILDFLNKHPEIKKRFIYKYQRIRYGSYMFTYRRVAEEYKIPFLRRMSVDFYRAQLEGELKREYFTTGQWATLNNIIDDPDRWYLKNAKRTNSEYEKKQDYGQLEKRLELAQQEIIDLQKSISFRIGRVITWFPRKIRGGYRCYKENGIKYTIRRSFQKINLKKN